MRAAAVLRPFALLLWAAVSVAVAALLALVEVFWLPLRAGTVLVPVSVVGAVLGNVLLVDATHRASRSRVVAVLPALAWVVVVVAAAFRRPEGDLVVLGGGSDIGLLGLVFLLLGFLAAAVAVGRALAGPARPGAGAVRPPELVRDRAGSGSGGAR